MENRKELVEETIFFALFKTENSQHDRTSYFKTNKTYSEFMDWLAYNRGLIEKEKQTPASLHSFDIKYNSYEL